MSTSGLFRDAWKLRRCLVPADGWYEWKAENGGKQPYYFTRSDERPCYFAGLWLGEGFCMCTTAADGDLVAIHDRKPLSLDLDTAHQWLKEPIEGKTLARLAITAAHIKFHPVSKAVSNWRNDGPQLIQEQRPQPQKELW